MEAVRRKARVFVVEAIDRKTYSALTMVKNRGYRREGGYNHTSWQGRIYSSTRRD